MLGLEEVLKEKRIYMKKNKSILFSIIFIVVFFLMIFIEIPNLCQYIKTENIINIVLSSMLILVSIAGLCISIIYGVVKALNKEKKFGGRENGKKKKR